MYKLVFQFVIFLSSIVCYGQNAKVTVSSINNRYYNIFDWGGTHFSVNVSIRELIPLKNQLSEMALKNGDTLIAKQISNFKASIFSDISLDSLRYKYSDIAETNNYWVSKNIADFKDQYNKFDRFFVSIAIVLWSAKMIDKYIGRPYIESQPDGVFVHIDQKYGKVNYTISKDYKKIILSGRFYGQQVKLEINADPFDQKLLISDVSILSAANIFMEFSYGPELSKLVPKGIIMTIGDKKFHFDLFNWVIE